MDARDYKIKLLTDRVDMLVDRVRQLEERFAAHEDAKGGAYETSNETSM